MNFKNYCIIIMGETKGCKIEVVKIAEDTPRFLEAKGVTIATFLSVAEPGEITEYFKSFDRNFLVFHLDEDVSGFNLKDRNIQRLLFGHLDDSNDKTREIEERTNRLIEEINNKVSIDKPKSKKTNSRVDEIMDKLRRKHEEENGKYTISDDMSQNEMTDIINKILDKGTENLTEYDRETLTELSKRTSL